MGGGGCWKQVSAGRLGDVPVHLLLGLTALLTPADLLASI